MKNLKNIQDKNVKKVSKMHRDFIEESKKIMIKIAPTNSVKLVKKWR